MRHIKKWRNTKQLNEKQTVVAGFSSCTFYEYSWDTFFWWTELLNLTLRIAELTRFESGPCCCILETKITRPQYTCVYRPFLKFSQVCCIIVKCSGCTCSFCGRPRVQLDCSRVCVCECDRIVVNVSLDNSGLGWLTLCQE